MQSGLLKWEYILQGLWTANKGHGPFSLWQPVLFFDQWGSGFAAGGNRSTRRKPATYGWELK